MRVVSMSEHDYKALDMRPCHVCGDFGILRAKVKGEGRTEEALVYCDCDWFSDKKQAHIWALPAKGPRIEATFTLERVPLAWFLPDNSAKSTTRESFVASVMRVAGVWRERVRESETFWREIAPTLHVPLWTGRRFVASEGEGA